MGNERIVASGIYYYTSENITKSQLEFRTLISFSHRWYQQHDAAGVMRTFRLKRDGESNQHICSISTSEGRCIAFPNNYQHRVSPFELIDKTKPGYRKIIALFLVDPTLGQAIPNEDPDADPILVQPEIPSASTVPPQQADWVRKALDTIPSTSPFQKLPSEVKRLIAE